MDERLNRLKNRRMDTDNEVLKNRSFVENFEQRTQNTATKYTLGAMQEVDRRSTEISHEEAGKVQTALTNRLTKHGLDPVFRLQGSVPLNLHIRGVSDVDVLEIHRRYLTYAATGTKANTYFPLTAGTSLIEEVLNMRKLSEIELQTHFWAAKIDTDNAKSIQLSEGGFRRKIDVVPSHWFDSDDYQLHQQEIFRGVVVIDQFSRESIENFPFLFGHHIQLKSESTNEGAKSAIRLLKNLKSDSDEDVNLSSYDIASLVYRCPDNLIQRHTARELMILSGVQQWLSILCDSRRAAEALETPDGTRKILDKNEKWEGLLQLTNEVTSLSREVDKEIIGPFVFRDRDLGDVRKNLNESMIPLI
ncbi:hypothetical protein [uncultured Cohaesibacter sp.]|uniref:hypothetical protein n=1 Tax=uncultured Cohaesibacter sp. TaxID=1002546 RepID=UPI0029C801CE|nr:hypothetical protein [uncultured Cohaesibacter sp.]